MVFLKGPDIDVITVAAIARRPIAQRHTTWAAALTRLCLRAGIAPNLISSASVAFAALGAALMVWPAGDWAWWAATVCVQARLLCNMLDGSVAVEGGRGTALGPLFNEIPDRIADTLLLVALGHAAHVPEIGWLAAALAIGTAHIRQTGVALGLTPDFSGPLAKPQRMALLTACLLLQPAMAWAGFGRTGLLAGCWLIVAGAALTCISRLRHIARGLA
jgi:phosphatidylglycerophosphate synthase